MPRIPEAPAAGPIPGRAGLTPPGLAAAPFGIAADFAGEQSDAFFRARAAESAAMRKTQLATQSASMVSALTARQAEAVEHEDANSIVDTVTPAGQQDIQAIIESTQDPIVRSELEAEAPGMLADFDFNVLKIQRDRQKQDYLAEFPGIIDTYAEGIAIATDEGNPEQALALRESARMLIMDSPHHTGGQIAAELEVFDARLDTEHGNRLLEDSPGVMAGMSARELFDLLPNLDPDKRTEFKEKDRRNVGSRAISNVEIGVAEAQSISELDALQARTEGLHSSRFISPEKRTQVRKQIIARREKITQATGDLALYDAYRSGEALAFGADAQKVIDAGYQRDVAGTGTLGEIQQVELGIIGDTNMVPSQTVLRMNGIANSNRVDLIEAEAQHFDEIRQLAPQVIEGISDPARIMLENVSEARRLGVPTDQVVEDTSEFLKRDPSTRKQFEAMYDADVRADKPDGEWLIENAKDVPGFLAAPFTNFFNEDADIPFEILGPFSTRTRSWYLKDPKSGLTKARERALADMDRVYGHSNVGRRQFMAYPPAKFYPEWGGDNKAMQSQLVDDVVGSGQLPQSIIDEIGEASAGDSEAVRDIIEDRVFIMSDGQSGREYGRIKTIDPATGGFVESDERLTPSYTVWFIGDDDEPVQWIQEDGVTPHRWNPSFYDSPQGAEVQDAVNENLAEKSFNRELRAQREQGIMPPNRVVAAGNAVQGVMERIAAKYVALQDATTIRVPESLANYNKLSESEKEMALKAMNSVRGAFLSAQEATTAQIPPELVYGNMTEGDVATIKRLTKKFGAMLAAPVGG